MSSDNQFVAVEITTPATTELSQSPIGSLTDQELDDFCLPLNPKQPIADLDISGQAADSSPSCDFPINAKILNIYNSSATEQMQTDAVESHVNQRPQLIRKLVDNQLHLFAFCHQANSNSHLIASLCQLCHLNAPNIDLAHFTWVQLFIQMFNLLSKKNTNNILYLLVLY